MRWASFFFFVPFHASPLLILWQCQIHAFQISARPRSPAAHSPTLRLVLVPPLPFFFFFLRPFSLWIFLSFNLNAFSLHRHLLLLFSSQFFCFNFYYSFSFVFLYQQRTKILEICYESDPSFFNSKKKEKKMPVTHHVVSFYIVDDKCRMDIENCMKGYLGMIGSSTVKG